MNGKALCLLFSVLLLCIGKIGAQDVETQTEPEEEIRGGTFKVSSRLVEIRAVVTDKKGRIVENLKREDFELLENGRPQDADFFSITRVVDASIPREESKTEPQNRQAVSTREQLKKPSPRTAALFVDNLHLYFDSLNWVKANLHRFIDESLNPQDMVAVVTSDTDLGIAQQFTRNRQILRYAIDNIKLGYVQRKSRFTPYLAALVERTGTYTNTNPGDVMIEARAIFEAEEHLEDRWYSLTRARARQVLFEASSRRKTTLRALEDLIEQMIEVPGQRMIVIYSEGFSQLGRDAEYKDAEVKAVVDRALQSGVVIYSIDAKGLDADIDEIFNTSHYHFAAREEILDGLSDLAQDTGGELFRFTNNFSDSLARAFEANRYYYNLGYYLNPGADAPDAREIQVRVRNRPEYRVRIQRGRMPLDPETDREEEDGNLTPQQHLLMAVRSPVPKADLGVSAQMYFLNNSTDDKQVSLNVFLEGNNLQYKEEEEGYSFDLEMVYMIHDSAGKQVEAFTTDIEGVLTSERLSQARNYGYWYSKQLDLVPGVYQARIGIREKETGRMGTTTAWVEVQDPDKDGLALSSLILLDIASADAENSADISTGDLNRVKTLQGVRLYRQNEVCGYYFSLHHDRREKGDTEPELKMELMQGSVPVRKSEWRPLPIDNTDIDNKGWAYVGEKINLAGLAPGIYELRVSVKYGEETVQRIATLGIE